MTIFNSFPLAKYYCIVIFYLGKTKSVQVFFLSSRYLQDFWFRAQNCRIINQFDLFSQKSGLIRNEHETGAARPFLNAEYHFHSLGLQHVIGERFNSHYLNQCRSLFLEALKVLVAGKTSSKEK